MIRFSGIPVDIKETYVYTMWVSTGASINQHKVPINTFENVNYNIRELILYDLSGNIVLGFRSINTFAQNFNMIKFTDTNPPVRLWSITSNPTVGYIFSMTYDDTEASIFAACFKDPVSRVVLKIDSATGTVQWAKYFELSLTTMYLIKYKVIGSDRVLVATVSYDSTAGVLHNGFFRILLDSSQNLISTDLWFDQNNPANLKLPRALHIVSKEVFYELYVDVTSHILYLAVTNYAPATPTITITPQY